jgi:hypothetical protein
MLPLRRSTLSERRAAPRQVVAYRLDVVEPGGTHGCLLDVSLTGMRIRFRRAVDVSKIAALSIEFPRWLELGNGIELRGRFVWIRSTPAGDTEAGFAFDGPSRKEESVLRLLVQRLAEALAEDRAP